MTVAAITRLVGGRLAGHVVSDPVGDGAGDGAGGLVVDGPVVTDSREARPGSLYVARIGESMDGHDFVPDAAARGAVAALTTREVPGLPCVVVEDEQEAFATLAREVLDRGVAGGLLVVGVTGSSGKTSTKDLLGAVLAGHAETVANVGSLNGEVGVPLTICRITPTTRYLVAEMGARGVGHIEYLTRMAPPRIGIVLNVGTAHVGVFGSREAIARAKAELVQALPEDGVAVLNADDPLVAAMAGQTRARVILVGRGEAAHVRAQDVRLDAAGRPSFTLTTPAGSAPVSLGLHGEHHVGNALAAAAAALEAGMTLPAVAEALGRARPSSRFRMEVHDRSDGVTVVNDAYNANPDSMRAALRALAAMGGTGAARRRTWAVVGEMLELGDDSGTEHEAVGEAAASLRIDRVLAVGPGARPVEQAAARVRLLGGWSGEATYAADDDTAYAILCADLRRGDVVLLKSSNGAGLRFLGERLVQPAGTETEVGR